MGLTDGPSRTIVPGFGAVQGPPPHFSEDDDKQDGPTYPNCNVDLIFCGGAGHLPLPKSLDPLARIF